MRFTCAIFEDWSGEVFAKEVFSVFGISNLWLANLSSVISVILFATPISDDGTRQVNGNNLIRMHPEESGQAIATTFACFARGTRPHATPRVFAGSCWLDGHSTEPKRTSLSLNKTMEVLLAAARSVMVVCMLARSGDLYCALSSTSAERGGVPYNGNGEVEPGPTDIPTLAYATWDGVTHASLRWADRKV